MDERPYVTEEEKKKAREMDLLTYLEIHEPYEIQEISNTICTVTHDSLKIYDDHWYWFSRGIRGRGALDYLVEVQGYGFVEAVQRILADDVTHTTQAEREARARVKLTQRNQKPKKTFTLPEAAPDNSRVYKYLQCRGINKEVIDTCIQNRVLFQSDYKAVSGNVYSNCVYVGYDPDNVPRYGFQRGCFTKYCGEIQGSNKLFSYVNEPSQDQNDILVLTECAIDADSFATMALEAGNSEWRNTAYLSLGGIGKVALWQYLKDHPHKKRVITAFDHDEQGLKTTQNLIKALNEKGYLTLNRTPPYSGLDVNKQLMLQKGLDPSKIAARFKPKKQTTGKER